MRRIAGFTLLEVLIALAVLAISSLAVLSQTGQSIKQLQLLEAKTMALWIAENQLNTLRASDQWPGLGRRSQRMSMVNQEWIISTEISATSEPWLRKVTVDVSTDVAGSEVALLTLTGYKGKY